MYVNVGQNCGWNKGNESYVNKRYVSENWKIIECFNCIQIEHWKTDVQTKKTWFV